MSWWDALWLGMCVAGSPGYLSAACAALSIPAWLLGEFHLVVAAAHQGSP